MQNQRQKQKHKNNSDNRQGYDECIGYLYQEVIKYITYKLKYKDHQIKK